MHAFRTINFVVLSHFRAHQSQNRWKIFVSLGSVSDKLALDFSSVVSAEERRVAPLSLDEESVNSLHHVFVFGNFFSDHCRKRFDDLFSFRVETNCLRYACSSASGQAVVLICAYLGTSQASVETTSKVKLMLTVWEIKAETIGHGRVEVLIHILTEGVAGPKTGLTSVDSDGALQIDNGVGDAGGERNLVFVNVDHTNEVVRPLIAFHSNALGWSLWSHEQIHMQMSYAGPAMMLFILFMLFI